METRDVKTYEVIRQKMYKLGHKDVRTFRHKRSQDMKRKDMRDTRTNLDMKM